MEWLLILGLALWLWIERGRIGRLETRLDQLSRLHEPALEEKEPVWAAPSQPAAAPKAPLVAARKPEPEPEVSPEPEREAARPAPDRPVRTLEISNWLAENGLAWLGGGALALGGLFLVVYASQRGFFTPPMRIAAAVLAGGLMLAASEWIRRQTRIAAHPLAAAAAAGAGGATLYGAIWSAQQLYHLIPFELGAGLIVLCSVGLLAYALLHGEALAVLALFGAFAAPVLTGVGDWRTPAPEAYLTAMIVTGFAFSALRRWPAAGYATIAGAFLWSAAALVETAPLKAALLLLAFAGGACLAVGWRARADDEPLDGQFARQPMIAVGLASLLALLVWREGFAWQQGWIGVATVAVLSAIAAAALVRGLLPALAFAAPIAAACVASLFVAADYAGPRPFVPGLAPLMLAPVLIAAIGWATSLRLAGRDRLAALASASLGAAFVATVTRFMIDGLEIQQPWAASAVTSGLMFAGAWVLARTSDDAGADRGLALWLAGAVELLLLAVAGGVVTAWEPAAQALAAAVLVLAALRLRWLGLAQAAVVAALVAFAAMLRPGFMGEAFGGAMPMAVLLGSTAAATAITFAGGMGLDRAGRRTEAEALRTASLLMGLFAAFIVIERLLAAPVAPGPDQHFSAALRTVLLLAASLVLAVRMTSEDGWLSRWRLRILLAAGLVHGLLIQSLVFSPWWGLGEPPLGPPVLNTLIIAYLAPALLLAALYRRGIEGRPAWTRSVAVGAFLFGLLWTVLTLRHAFHPGATMDSAPLLRGESCAYVIILVLAASALIWLRRRSSQGARWLAQAAQPAGWAALAVGAMVFWGFASPWWGEQGAPLATGEALLLFALYLLSAGATVVLQRQAANEEDAGWPYLAQAAVIVAVVDLLVLATLLVRFAFHGGDMQARFGGGGLETWAYSAVWALFGLGVLVAGGAWRNYTLRWLGLGVLLVTAAKVLLFDTSRLEGMIRAASFLALGVLLIVGALAARRLNARALLFAPKD